jgi:hypothetical protein
MDKVVETLKKITDKLKSDKDKKDAVIKEYSIKDKGTYTSREIR